MTLLGLETDETLLIGKIAFLVLLYVFILFVMRSATRGMTKAPQESIILGAAEANALRAEHGLEPARLLVLASPELGEGRTIEVAGRRWSDVMRRAASDSNTTTSRPAVMHASSHGPTERGWTTSARPTAPSSTTSD